MYLFTRRVRLAPGQSREALAWAIDQTERVNRITGINVSAYTSMFSPEVGTVAWSAFVPDLTALEEASDKLAVDDEFVTATDRGAKFVVGGAHDTLGMVLHGEPDPGRTVEYVGVVRAVCASGKLGRGLELGTTIAAEAQRITGTPTLFVSGNTGTYGEVAWIAGHADIRAMETAEQALMADPGWLELIDGTAAGVYAEEPALTEQLVYRHIA